MGAKVVNDEETNSGTSSQSDWERRLSRLFFSPFPFWFLHKLRETCDDEFHDMVVKFKKEPVDPFRQTKWLEKFFVTVMNNDYVSETQFKTTKPLETVTEVEALEIAKSFLFHLRSSPTRSGHLAVRPFVDSHPCLLSLEASNPTWFALSLEMMAKGMKDEMLHEVLKKYTIFFLLGFFVFFSDRWAVCWDLHGA